MRDLVVEVLEPAESAGAIKLEPLEPVRRKQCLECSTRETLSGRPPGATSVHLARRRKIIVCILPWAGRFVYQRHQHGLVSAGGNRSGDGRVTDQGSSGLACSRKRLAARLSGRAGARSVPLRLRGALILQLCCRQIHGDASRRNDSSFGLPIKERASVAEYVEGSRKTIEVLSQEFGPYPSGEFAIVEVPEKQADAAGFTGASVASFIMVTGSFLDQKFNLAYYGHEIAHQWWGNLIRRTGTRGRWMLDEAMAQYGSLRVVETLEGAEAAEQYRRTGYPGYYGEQSAVGYLKVLAAGKDFPLANIPSNADRSIPDGKGFQVWDLLSRTLGREKFRRILRDFTAKHAFQRVTWEEFLQAVERGAGRNVKWFFDQWFERPGVPDWQLTWRQKGGNVRGEITQTPPYFRATLEVEATSRDGLKQSVSVEVKGAKTDFKLPLKFEAETVTLDPHYRVLRWTPEYRALAAKP